TGEALVPVKGRGDIGNTINGDVMSAAARIKTHAPRGSVAVGEPTHRVTANAFEYDVPRVVRTSRSGEPLVLRRVLRSRTNLASIPSAGARSPFVGRSVEAELLAGTV